MKKYTLQQLIDLGYLVEDQRDEYFASYAPPKHIMLQVKDRGGLMCFIDYVNLNLLDNAVLFWNSTQMSSDPEFDMFNHESATIQVFQAVED
jgi:hypothetical protein